MTRAAVGGALTLVIATGAAGLLGFGSYFEARRLVEALRAVLPFLGSASMGASASVLALMLTLLGISRTADTRLTELFYRRILWIGRQASALFFGSLLLLLTLAVPIIETDALDGAQDIVVLQYYATSVLLALMTGLAVSMILMLQSTLSDLIMVLGLRVKDHPLVKHDDDDE
ncbi:hypothetical protein [Enhygromyxa salina]|uniref:Uncharacterized protein n=1 Tax=Enhygromyxa salina TaxID=215803 RepID=A0A2S9XQU6_9BACT|nr:hypothetical protein [Enhygromyxa salina]PRP95237.1 hypothetical protein ENSA7_75510 [Enhygromyxa salina]